MELLKAHFGVIPITPWLTAADALVGTGIKCSSVTFQQTVKATVECKMEACREKKSKKILTPKDFIGLGPYYIGMQPEGDFTGFWIRVKTICRGYWFNPER